MEIHSVDLALPKQKEPTALADFSFGPLRTVEDIVGRTYAMGSSSSQKDIYHKEDLGLFQCVYECWKHHWNLRTSPEDWWSPVATQVAKAIDKAAKSGNQRVREHFVDHDGKKKICIDVDVFTIDQVDFESFFSALSSELKKQIKCPEYARVMQNDFSTSSASHRIESQINLMASMQEFFDYEMGMCGCGIKGVEMLGTQEDWENLSMKLRELRKQLKPIQSSLIFALSNGWLDHVEKVFHMLAKTYAANDAASQKEIADFWADIFLIGEGWKYGPSGFGGHPAKEYNGWLVEFLSGYSKILKEDFFGQRNMEKLSGLNQVPMTITFKYKDPPISDESTLIAGIMGFQLHIDTFNGEPSLQPNHMWAMELPPDSPLRATTL